LPWVLESIITFPIASNDTPKLPNLTLYTNLLCYFICIIEASYISRIDVQQTETDPLRVHATVNDRFVE